MLSNDLVRQLRRLSYRNSRTEIKTAPIVTGAYTPTYIGGTTAGVTTYSSQVGFWTRKGREITAWGTVIWTAATGTGNAQISLPFAASSVASSNFAGSVRIQNVTFANGSVQLQVTAGAQFFILHSPATNAAGTNVAVEAAGTIIWTAVYSID